MRRLPRNDDDIPTYTLREFAETFGLVIDSRMERRLRRHLLGKEHSWRRRHYTFRVTDIVRAIRWDQALGQWRADHTRHRKKLLEPVRRCRQCGDPLPIRSILPCCHGCLGVAVAATLTRDDVMTVYEAGRRYQLDQATTRWLRRKLDGKALRYLGHQGERGWFYRLQDIEKALAQLGTREEAA